MQEEKGRTEDEMVDGINDSMDMSLQPGTLQSTGSQRVGHNLVTKEQQQHCTYTSFKAQKTMFPIVA